MAGGGGIYPLDEWLDACDEFGVLGIIDMQFSTDGIFPGAKDTPTQEAEIRHQIRRMGHHASIAIWSGCNECGSIGHLIDVVAEEDQSRAIRAASPSSGFSAGVSRLSGADQTTSRIGRHASLRPSGAFVLAACAHDFSQPRTMTSFGGNGADFPTGGLLVGGPSPKAPGSHWAPGERHGPYAKGCSSNSRSINGPNSAPKPVNPVREASCWTLSPVLKNLC